MKDGVMIINTSRGGLLDSNAAIEALKTFASAPQRRTLRPREGGRPFFEDKSNEDHRRRLCRLSVCYNVLFTGHQAF